MWIFSSILIASIIWQCSFVSCVSRDLEWHRNEIIQAVEGYCLRANHEDKQSWIQERERLEKQIKQLESEPPIVIERFVEEKQQQQKHPNAYVRRRKE
jgi:hypothetical protein